MARYEIEDGPSKWDLILAIFDGDSNHRREVTFSIECPGFNERGFTLNGASREDGSGDNWIIHGYCSAETKGGKMSGFYSTKTRKGWLEF